MPDIRLFLLWRSMDLLWPLRRMRCMKRRSFLVAAAAPLVTAAFPRALTAATNGGGVVALVTADLESRIVAVDTSSGRIVKHIPTVPGPRSVEGNVFGQALVAHTSLGRVSILDTATLTVVAELAGLGEPRYTAMHPSERIAYVSDSKGESVIVVDLARRRIAGHVALPGPARHLSLSDDGRRLWVVLGSKAGRVAILDADNPLRPALRHTLVPPFLAHDVAWAPGSERVWLTSGARGKIAVYGRESATPLALLRADAPPQHVAFSRSRAYVTSGDDGTLSVHRLDGSAAGPAARVPVGSYNVSLSDPDTTFGQRLGVTPSLGGGTVCLFAANGATRIMRRVARSAHDACIVEAG